MTNEREIVPAQQPAVVRSRNTVMSMTIPDAMTFAQAVARADGMIPKSYLNNPGKILACIMAGQELGVGPMASLRAFHVVEGKPVASYDFWIARLRAAGYRVEWPELSAERVTLRLTAPNGETHTETWDKARAQAAGLWGGKDPWRKYPQTMLQARCVATAGRAFAGEVMFGCYETDESHELRGDRAAPVEPAIATTAVKSGWGIDGDEKLMDEEVIVLADRVRQTAKSLGHTRESLWALMASHGLPQQGLASLTKQQLDVLAGALSAEVADRDADEQVEGDE